MTVALGMTFGFGTVVLLFYNGVVLGAVAFDYVHGGQSVFLLGWLLPHGVIEIPAIHGRRANRLRPRVRIDRMGKPSLARGPSARRFFRCGHARRRTRRDAGLGRNRRGVPLAISRTRHPLWPEDLLSVWSRPCCSPSSSRAPARLQIRNEFPPHPHAGRHRVRSSACRTLQPDVGPRHRSRRYRDARFGAAKAPRPAPVFRRGCGHRDAHRSVFRAHSDLRRRSRVDLARSNRRQAAARSPRGRCPRPPPGTFSSYRPQSAPHRRCPARFLSRRRSRLRPQPLSPAPGRSRRGNRCRSDPHSRSTRPR